MTKQEFLNYLNDLGFDTNEKNLHFKLGLYIGDRPSYSPYYRECCYKDGNEWVRFMIDERGHMTVFERTDEDKCFETIKRILPDLLSDIGIHDVQNSKAYALTKQELMDYLMDNYDMKKQRAEKQYETLRKNINLLMEFKKYVKEGAFMKEKYALAPCGWTAKKLYETYSLSPLGAFNYIQYLCDEPEEALKHLSEGLKNKDTFFDISK